MQIRFDSHVLAVDWAGGVVGKPSHYMCSTEQMTTCGLSRLLAYMRANCTEHKSDEKMTMDQKMVAYISIECVKKPVWRLREEGGVESDVVVVVIIVAVSIATHEANVVKPLASLVDPPRVCAEFR